MTLVKKALRELLWLGMNLHKIIKRLKDACFSMYEKVKIKEPDMPTIIFDVDTSCQSIRREFELYEEEGFFDIDRVYKCLDKIEGHANKIDDYEEETIE